MKNEAADVWKETLVIGHLHMVIWPTLIPIIRFFENEELVVRVSVMSPLVKFWIRDVEGVYALAQRFGCELSQIVGCAKLWVKSPLPFWVESRKPWVWTFFLSFLGTGPPMVQPQRTASSSTWYVRFHRRSDDEMNWVWEIFWRAPV